MKIPKKLRRDFISNSMGLVAGAAFTSSESKAQQRGPFSHPAASFDVAAESAVIWVRGLDEKQKVQFQWSKDQNLNDGQVSEAVELSKESDYISTYRISNLEANTNYYCRPISRRDNRREHGDTFQFRTAPNSATAFTFVVGADVLASYSPFRLFDRMAEVRPDFFIHLGDTIYADHPSRFLGFEGSLRTYREKHAENRTDMHMQSFMRAVPTFAIWDDHEVQDNFDGTHPKLREGLQAFSEWWPNANPNRSRLYRMFSWGTLADFFMLDTRQYRSPSRAHDDEQKTMLGKEQKEWLKQSLQQSKAPLKILLSPSPFNSRTDDDSWRGYRTERREIDEFIFSNQIKKVVILSGDWHLALDLSKVASRIDEVVVGPIAAWPQFEINPNTRSLLASSGLAHVGDTLNFGFGTIEAIGGIARFTLNIVDLGGRTRFTKIFDSA